MLRHTTHLAMESLRSLRGGDATAPTAEIQQWQRRGKSVAAIFHGSDIRLPSRHMERLPGSEFRLFPPDDLAHREADVTERHVRMREANIPTFVSTPDLLIDAPDARWLPLVVAPAKWASSSSPVLERRRLRVLHIPSRRHPPVKGTDVIEPVLLDLHSRGVVEYLAPERVPHSQMPQLIGSADIVIDQIRTASYGVTAVEALAAGRLVVGYIAPDVRELADVDIPIADARVTNFADDFANILDHRDDMMALAAEGPRFVRQVHDGRAAAEAMRSWLTASVTEATQV